MQPGVFNRACVVASVGTSSTFTEFALRVDSETPWRGFLFGAELGRQSKELLRTCGYVDLCTHTVCHASGKLSRLWGSGSWRLAADWSLRDLDARHPHPSVLLQQERLRSLKTSLNACLSWRSLQVTTEVAGPPGDVTFCKAQAVVDVVEALPALPWPKKEEGEQGWQLHLAGVARSEPVF